MGARGGFRRAARAVRLANAMRVLYHTPLHAGCRKIRLQLQEKGLAFELKTE